MKTVKVPTHIQHLTQAYQQFQEYSKTHPLPPKIIDKLHYLARSILKEPISMSDYPTLGWEEISDMEDIQELAKTKLFLSTAACVMGEEDVDPMIDREVFLKRDSFWMKWNSCCLSYTDDLMVIDKGKEKKSMELGKLKVITEVVSYEKFEKKYSFGIEYNSNKYRLGFGDEKVAQKYCKRIKHLVDIAHTDSLTLEKSNCPEIGALVENEDEVEVSEMESEQNLCFVAGFQVDTIESESNFKILHTSRNGRILQHTTIPNRYKHFMLVECCDCPQVMEYLVRNSSWNPDITEDKIIGRTQQNCYLVYESHKPSSYLSMSRDYILMKMGIRKEGRYLLLERSVMHPTYPEFRLKVRGNVERKVTAFVPHLDKQQMLLITEMDIDFGGYSAWESKKNLTLRYFESYQHLPRFVTERSFLPSNNTLFDFEANPRLRNTFLSKSTFIQNESAQEMTKEDEPFVPLSQEFASLIPRTQSSLISDRLLELISQKLHHLHSISHFSPQSPDLSRSLLHSKTQKSDTILRNDWKFLEATGEIQFINERAIAAQKDIIKYILKQIGTNLLKGKSIMSMSLPVDIFDNKSLLERIAGSFGYVPILFKKAAESKDELQQIKLVSVFLSTVNLLQMKLEKPFNPILGETFQGYLGGIPVCLEQISHHPPISAFYMETDEFMFYGNLEAKVEMGLNSIEGFSCGFLHVEFKQTKVHFECVQPGIEISGIVSGARKFRVINKAAIICRQSNLYSQISFGKDKKDVYPSPEKLKANQLIGGVYRILPHATERLYKEMKKDTKFSGISPKDIEHKLGVISGSWNGEIVVDGESAMRLYDPMPYQLCYDSFPLASDCNFREDLLYRRMENFSLSQTSKEILETLQRSDRKLRSRKH